MWKKWRALYKPKKWFPREKSHIFGKLLVFSKGHEISVNIIFAIIFFFQQDFLGIVYNIFNQFNLRSWREYLFIEFLSLNYNGISFILKISGETDNLNIWFLFEFFK